MSKKKRITFIIVWLLLIAAITAGVFLTSPAKGEESIQTTMRDAVLHGTNKIDFFGIEVNPAMIGHLGNRDTSYRRRYYKNCRDTEI